MGLFDSLDRFFSNISGNKALSNVQNTVFTLISYLDVGVKYYGKPEGVPLKIQKTITESQVALMGDMLDAMLNKKTMAEITIAMAEGVRVSEIVTGKEVSKEAVQELKKTIFMFYRKYPEWTPKDL